MSEDLPKLEWTGERYLPWIKNATLAYEHLHRYAFAARYAKDKHVLDLGSGEGYGADILSRTAASVVGVDIDHTAIQHAAAKYRRANLRFDMGTFAHVPINENCSFDLIVCFEAIEHILNQDELLGEVKRLIKPGGLFMVSTPSKTEYHKESAEINPFHLKELEPEEFQQLLGRYFRESRFLGQRIHPGSSIWPLGSSNSCPIEELAIERGGSEFDFIGNENRTPIYVIALASDSPDTLRLEGSVLIDSSGELLNDNKKTIRELLETRESNEADLVWHVDKLNELRESVAKLISDLNVTQIRLEKNTTELQAIYASKIWKILNKCWNVRDTLLPLGTLRRQLMQRILTLVTPDTKG